MTQTLAELIEQKQKDAAAWTTLQRVIAEANLTPEEEDQIFYCLGVSSPHQIDRHETLSQGLGVGECSVRVSS